MKKTWDEPRIEVQRFVAGDYCAGTVCALWETTGIVVIIPDDPDWTLTDGVNGDTSSSGSGYNSTWQGPEMGFSDDHFDFLNASGDDTKPSSVGNGWFSDTIDPLSDNFPNMQIHSSSKAPDPIDGGPYGNNALQDMADPVYFWGYWWKVQNSQFTSNGVTYGPNAS